VLFVRRSKLSLRLFFFYHEQNKVKPDFLVISKSPLFARETAENMFYKFVVLLFVRRTAGENSMRSGFFFIAGENSMRIDRTCSIF
jgi:hypothetical protein